MVVVLDVLIDPRSGPFPHQRRDYRVCAIGREGDSAGQPASWVEIGADDDAEAVHLTRPLGAFHAVELWSGRRFLARFGPGEIVRWGDVDAGVNVSSP